MTHPLDRPLRSVAAALRSGELTASELLEEALRRHDRHSPPLGAYVYMDRDGARSAARAADRRLSAEGHGAPLLCGIPVSVKDLYGVEGQPIWAGTARRLPDSWSSDAWLVARLREHGAVFVGRTHTVELAFGAVGSNPHHGTPRNPHDPAVHRVPGGSSAGAGASLVEGSALVALGTDTGGSIRIPASLSGTVGHKTTRGRWPTTGVVPLSPTLDTVGVLTRTVADSIGVFDAVDPQGGAETQGDRRDPTTGEIAGSDEPAVRVGLPRAAVTRAAPDDIADPCRAAIDVARSRLGWTTAEFDAPLLDDAERHYMEGGLIAAECRAFLEDRLPGWIDALDPRVAARLRDARPLSAPEVRRDALEMRRLAESASTLFADADVLAWPTHTLAAPPVSELSDLDAYLRVNRALLAPTSPVSALGLCAVTIPVGRDAAGLPVGLQLVAPGGDDRRLLAVAARLERVLRER